MEAPHWAWAMIGGLTTVEGRGAGAVGAGDTVAAPLGVAGAVGVAGPVGGVVRVAGLAGVAVGAGVTARADATVFGARPVGSVPGSRSFTSMPGGSAEAEPSVATTRTSTPSEGPVHTAEVPPPQVAASSASLPSAEKGSSGSACQPDHLPVPAAFERLWAVPLSLASGSDQVSRAALYSLVSCFGSPLRPAPWPASSTVRTAADRTLWSTAVPFPAGPGTA
ncbi:hypothetical protein [Streptomyces sp. ITFR-6]|uniref:hypothetical protein n=1 Tax=Streptomyces sp. ITFR-6 TaxID=3075197 RepID=UPI00288B626E|nr:hypothetical protein [Streptomyces sp. ITFR-6]WNI31262.1 hypothetical protein RLT59_22585 [Streptomyces sp. ITFR-6]